MAGLGIFERVIHRSSGGPVGGPYQALEWASWEANVQRHGLEVTVSREEDQTPVSAAELTAAGGRMLALLEREEAVKHEVAAALLEPAQDWWFSGDRDVDGPPLTLDVFEGLLRLDAVTIEEDGGLTVYYDDGGEVFAGHAVQASFSADGVFLEASMAG